MVEVADTFVPALTGVELGVTGHCPPSEPVVHEMFTVPWRVLVALIGPAFWIERRDSAIQPTTFPEPRGRA
jgi:hypothetical protein